MTNAEEVNGTCQCKVGWTGNDCLTECHPICVGCNGSSDQACIECVENAEKNSQGVCECK